MVFTDVDTDVLHRESLPCKCGLAVAEAHAAVRAEAIKPEAGHASGRPCWAQGESTLRPAVGLRLRSLRSLRRNPTTTIKYQYSNHTRVFDVNRLHAPSLQKCPGRPGPTKNMRASRSPRSGHL